MHFKGAYNKLQDFQSLPQRFIRNHQSTLRIYYIPKPPDKLPG